MTVTARDGKPVAAVQAAPAGEWFYSLEDKWQSWSSEMWSEIRQLIRVRAVDTPDALLLSPGQAYYARENLKLRLLNARLALLSRQFDTAQSDLRDAQSALDRYFDRSGRRVASAAELVRQVATQARLVTVPRPDATLAAIATASAGR